MTLTRRTARAAVLLMATGLMSAVVPAAATGASAAQAPVAGAQTSGDNLFPNVGNGGYDALHYDLDLAWTPGVTLAQSTLDGSATIRASTTGAPLSSYSLDFERGGMTVSSVTVDGAPATFESVEDPAAIKHKLVITPTTPVEGEFTTVVTYAGVPTRHTDADGSYEGWNVTADGATFVNQPIGSMTGYPNNNTPADKATYTIDIDIPNQLTGPIGGQPVTGPAAAASNGELVAQEPNGADRTTWRWRQDEPMASELAMISIGKYDVIERDVTLASGRTLPEWSFVDPAVTSANRINVDTQLGRWKTVLDGLESMFGPYPGDSVGAVVDIVPSAINYALETQDRSFFPSGINANTFVHEAAHQWYGNNVSPTDWNELYINEGMATWAPTYFNNAVAEPPTSGTTTEGTYFTSWNNQDASSPNWTVPPGGITDAADLYGYQTYTRSAQLWEALRLSIGDDAFFELIREWQVRYAGQSRGTEALAALAEEISGRDLDAFFTDWVFDADKPAWPQRFDLSLSEAVSSEPPAPGDSVTYTLTAANRGYVALTSSVATIDLSDVLDDADLDAESLPAGLSLEGDTLTWQVPATARRSREQVSFDVVVGDLSSNAVLRAVAAPATLGGLCGPGNACTSRVAVPVQPLSPAPAPTLSGAARVGEPLTAGVAGWPADVRFSYQWLVDGAEVDDATGRTYTPRAGDLGKAVTVAVTGVKEGYAATTRVSAPSAAVALGTQTRRPRPRVSGQPVVGRVLRAVPGTHDQGVRVGYRWLVGGKLVAGARGATFSPRGFHRGRAVKVRVIGIKPGYARVVKTSAPTAKVR